tara:strand:+ start:630 stop:3611 length:2982 start_codon:yes stop_codon:yes gene_type:complete
MSLMGYRSTLLRSVIALTIFYSLAAATAFYFMGPETLQEWLAGAGFWVEGDEEINPANAASAATEVVLARLRVVWPWLAGGMAAGSVIVLLIVGMGLITRRQRAKSRGEFRGMDLSITYMPYPDPINFKPVKAQLSGNVPAHHMPLINQLLGYLQAHPDAFCGDGHSTTLLEHHLGVIDEAFEYEGADPLLPLAAAAHDIGKTVSHAKQDGQWVRLSYHDKQSGRLLAKFPAWWELPEDERAILLLAVKYEHSPNLMPVAFPGLSSKGVRRAVTLLQQLREIDGLATRGEKRKVLENLNVQELAIETFLRVVPQVPYQVKGLAKRVKAAGFRVGERLYLSEHHVRETALSKLDDDVAAAFGGDFRARGKSGEFTQVLLAALADRGWLITEIEGVPEGSEAAKTWTLPSDQALWRVRSGIIEFRGMIAVELPVEHQGLYPRETAYEVTVLGPQGKHSSNAGVAPTKDSGKREECMTKPKGIPASDVCDVSLFASVPTGTGDATKTSGNAAQKSLGAASKTSTFSHESLTNTDVASAWLLDDSQAAGGNTAQEETRQPTPCGGDAAQKGNGTQNQQASAMVETGEGKDIAGAKPMDDLHAAGGDTAQEETRQPIPCGGDAAQKGNDTQNQQASAMVETGEEKDIAGAKLMDDLHAAGGNTAQEEMRQPTPCGGDAAQKGNGTQNQQASAMAETGGEKVIDGAWLLDDSHTAGENTTQEGTGQPIPCGGDAAQKGNDAQNQQASAKAETGDEKAIVGAWLLEDVPGVGGDIAHYEQDGMSNSIHTKTPAGFKRESEGAWLLNEIVEAAGGNVAQIATNDQISPTTSGGDVELIAEQAEPTNDFSEISQLTLGADADNHSDVSAELGDWSPEADNAPNDTHIQLGLGEAMLATAEHESPVTQPSHQPVPTVMVDKTTQGATEQQKSAVSGQKDVRTSSPIQRRLKKRGGTSAGRQKALNNEAPADKSEQTGQVKASRGSSKPAGAKAEVKGVPKLFS